MSLKNQLKQIAKRAQLGVLFYQVYYAPKGFIQKITHRGWRNVAIDYQAQRQMERAAYQLQPIQQNTNRSFRIHFLTGKRFWYQSCFCAYSMLQHSPIAINPIFYDDGTLTQKYQDALRKIFPDAQIVSLNEIEEYINAFLPQNKFPYLRERRQNYPNLRKLTDIHVGSKGWKLVLDSDMLFFQTPHCLLTWLQAPQYPCHMVDVENAYGYSETLMSSLAEAPIPERINVGICGLKSEDINWEQLEHWCKTMIEQEGTSYYQEQALIAMLMAKQPRSIAPVENHIVMPNYQEVIQPTAVMHHYVADSKPWYFRYGWKHILDCDRSLKLHSLL